MPSIPVQEAFVAVAAADAHGNLTVANADPDAVLLYPGTFGWLTLDDGSKQVRVQIKRLVVGDTNTTVQVGPGEPEFKGTFGSISYGRMNVADYDGGAAHLCVEAQAAPIDPAYSKRQGVG